MELVINYYKHLIANLKVSLRCLISCLKDLERCFLHFLHGVIPCKYTSHDFLELIICRFILQIIRFIKKGNKIITEV